MNWYSSSQQHFVEDTNTLFYGWSNWGLKRLSKNLDKQIVIKARYFVRNLIKNLPPIILNFTILTKGNLLYLNYQKCSFFFYSVRTALSQYSNYSSWNNQVKRNSLVKTKGLFFSEDVHELKFRKISMKTACA